MPNELSNLCAVKYNESHIYLTGGYHKNSGYTNKVWIFNKVTTAWTEGPLMINKRAWHGCTILHHEQGSWIVVSGGESKYKTMEILDVKRLNSLIIMFISYWPNSYF